MTPKSFYAMLSEPGANLLCKVRGFSAGRKGRTANLRDMMALPCRRVRLWIATIGIEAVAGLIVLGFVNAPPIRAQSAPTANAPLLSFEVASVKRSFPGESTSFHVLPNRFTVRAYLIKMLILVVYGQDLGEFGLSELRFNQIEGGPKWIYSDGFTYDGYDIDAKVDDSLAEKFGKDCGVAFSRGRCGYRNQMLLMVQSLLADRFKLQVRHEKREASRLCPGCRQRRSQVLAYGICRARLHRPSATPATPAVPGGDVMHARLHVNEPNGRTAFANAGKRAPGHRSNRAQGRLLYQSPMGTAAKPKSNVYGIGKRQCGDGHYPPAPVFRAFAVYGA